LETQVEHLAETVEKLTASVRELNELLAQAKGAKWALLLGAGGLSLLSGLFGAKGAAWLQWLGALPK
jgi:hypothetical protein